ncbi:hypothetical protein [Streptomyces sp. 2P-4]|uniref:hypothetical protein n=1 Tax=Streptomyces sp. 2P-4 TaxID=2931974 RepID=UPI0025423D0C|nr:hypothetical protein [Streptomyces sp. 2P-4]
MSLHATVTRALPSLGGLAAAGAGVLADAPWWLVGVLGFAALLVLRAEALVNARNEARRGSHEHRLLATVSGRQALDYLTEVRRAQAGPAAAPGPGAEGGAAGGGTA